MRFVYVVIGGGIAGVSCAETLAEADPRAPVLLVSESCLVKSTRNLVPVTKMVTKFDVCEIDWRQFERGHSNVVVVHDRLAAIDPQNKLVSLANKKAEKIHYDYLCVCTGAQPKRLPLPDGVPCASQVLTIRDTDSVHNFAARIRNASRIAIVGNGGIASELVFKCDRVQVDWIVRDDHISATFADAGASEFLLRASLDEAAGRTSSVPTAKSVSRCAYVENDSEVGGKHGAALGPNWYRDLAAMGSSSRKKLRIHYDSEVRRVRAASSGNGLELVLGKKGAAEAAEAADADDANVIAADLVVVAIGVDPKPNFRLVRASGNEQQQQQQQLAMDANGVFVNEHMETSLSDIFAAGDICHPTWQWAANWFPMKLWTQAKQTGHYAAKCMIAKRTGTIGDLLPDFCFELFTHSTSLFGHDVVLLGQFNAQKVPAADGYDCLVRCTPGHEYIKLVISRTDRCLLGAILIGDCSMAETFENLILNRLDVSVYGDDLLNPDIDIDDYFD